MEKAPNAPAPLPGEPLSALDEVRAALSASGYDESDYVDERILAAISNNDILREELLKRPSRIRYLSELFEEDGTLVASPAELDTFLYDMHLYEYAVDSGRREFRERVYTNPKATDLELRIGAYLESLEPQVRTAVTSLFTKGWVTFESGFFQLGNGSQYLGFVKGQDVATYADTPEVHAVLGKYPAVSLSVDTSLNDRDMLVLTSSGRLSLDDWKQVWDAIVATFPPIPHQSVHQSDIPIALQFRARQEKLSRGEDVYLDDGFHFENGKVVEK